MKKGVCGLVVVGLVVVTALLAWSVEPADARGRVFVGVGIGVPFAFGGPFWYPYPYAYPYPYPAYSPPVVVESSPPMYIQREAQPAPAPQAQYWYYCQNAQAYYPYVKECPGGWMQVVPQASPPPTGAPR